jgi:hypothetical protein
VKIRKPKATDERLVELTKLCKCGRPLGFHRFPKPHTVHDDYDEGKVLCAGFEEAKP